MMASRKRKGRKRKRQARQMPSEATKVRENPAGTQSEVNFSEKLKKQPLALSDSSANSGQDQSGEVTAERPRRTEVNSPRKKLRVVFRYFLVGLAAVIVWEPVKILYRNLLEETWTTSIIMPPEYVIVVVGPQSGSDRNLWEDVIRGVNSARKDAYCQRLLKKADVAIRYEDDYGDRERAKNLAARLIANRNVLAIIGPCQSDIAEAVLPIYQTSGKPVLMPIPTNPQLTSQNQVKGVKNIFRLPPTDVNQVRVLSTFIRGKFHGKSLALFRDGSNQTYSTYIIEQVRDELELSTTRTDGTTPAYTATERMEVVIDGWVGQRGNGLFVTDTMAAMKLPVVLYAGMRDNALTLVRQAQLLGWKPTFILTDGSVDTRFLHLGGRRVEGIFATFPFGPVESGTLAMNPRPEWASEPSFAPYGYDAIKILAEAIDLASSRAKLSPETLTEAIRVSYGSRGFKGIAAEYRFDANGDSIGTRFHVWRVNNEQWTHAAQCPAHETTYPAQTREPESSVRNGN